MDQPLRDLRRAARGVLYVFMPPLEALDDYAALVAAVEATAAELGHPVMIEGYEPRAIPASRG